MKTLYSWHQRIVVVSSYQCKTLVRKASPAFPMPLYTYSPLSRAKKAPWITKRFWLLMGDELTHVYESLNKRREKNYNGQITTSACLPGGK